MNSVAEAITNTSPLIYLHRAHALHWLPQLFEDVWVPYAVVQELAEGARLGYDVPNPRDASWLHVVGPADLSEFLRSAPLGPGEKSAIALALDHPQRILLLDDAAARRVAEQAGCKVWGTLRVVLEAKRRGIITIVAPVIDELAASGMWLSPGIRERILRLAGE